MEISYKRELDQNYLILWQEEFRECYQVEMLVRNQIPGLLSCRLGLWDEKAALYYEITSRQSLRLLLERKRLNAKELYRLLESLQKAVQACGAYLLDGKQLLLNPDYIYLEPDTWELAFCYVPFEEQDMQEALLSLAEYLLDRLERQDQNAVTLGYEFYRMAGEENASLNQLLEKCKANQGACEKNEMRLIEEKERTQTEKQEEMVKSEKGFASEKSETVFLKREEKRKLTLRSENQACPDLEITGTDFLIGKKKGVVDGLIKARGVSRIHGKITKEGDDYYLTDLNSTNGTYLNGGRLEVHEKARIRQGDSIGFADVRYVVET